MPTERPRTLLQRLTGLARRLWRELLAFGTVGLGAFIVDTGSYNLLVFGPVGPTDGFLAHKPTTASIVATILGTIFSWLGNRHWTYRHQRRAHVGHEAALFVLFNAIALVITAGFLYLSRYGLGLHGIAWDNLARFVGIGIGTIFRFLTYRRFVFTGVPTAEIASADESPLGDRGAGSDESAAPARRR